MGKWTPEHYRNVLANKLDSMVTAVIKRSKLDAKDGPSISYQAFIEDLDSGDAFTTGLVEILVKELADRRTRNSDSERALIAERSARSLHRLAAPVRVLGRRRFAEYSNYIPPEGFMPTDGEDDEFDDFQTHTMEGVHLNTDLYEAYTAVPDHLPVPTEAISADTSDSPPPPLTRTWPSLDSRRLSRMPSLRHSRGPRTAMRATDFDDFSLRRRSSFREGRSPEEPPILRELSPVREPATDSAEASHSALPSTIPGRRYFPFSNRRRQYDSGPSGFSFPLDRGSPYDEPNFAAESQGWFIPTPPSTSSLEDHSENTGEDRLHYPRLLRRGGVRAPEAILPMRVSPAVSTTIAPSTSETAVQPTSSAAAPAMTEEIQP